MCRWSRIVLLFFLLLSACEKIPAVRRFYYSYIDPPPKISLDATKLSKGEQQLALATMPLYEALEKLQRFLAVNDKIKYSEWFRALVAECPWLQGAGIINASGGVLFAQPEGLFAQVDFSPLIQVKTTGLRLQQKAMYVVVSEENAFVFLAQPVYTGEELTEFRTVCFDLATFSKFAPNAERLYFIGDNKILWRGSNVDPDSKILTTKWEKQTKDTVFGKLKHKSVESWYIVVYLGSVPFVIALDAE